MAAEPVVDVARALVAGGVEAIVVTLGSAGIVAVTAQGVLVEPARSIEIDAVLG